MKVKERAKVKREFYLVCQKCGLEIIGNSTEQVLYNFDKHFETHNKNGKQFYVECSKCGDEIKGTSIEHCTSNFNEHWKEKHTKGERGSVKYPNQSSISK